VPSILFPIRFSTISVRNLDARDVKPKVPYCSRVSFFGIGMISWNLPAVVRSRTSRAQYNPRSPRFSRSPAGNPSSHGHSRTGGITVRSFSRYTRTGSGRYTRSYDNALPAGKRGDARALHEPHPFRTDYPTAAASIRIARAAAGGGSKF